MKRVTSLVAASALAAVGSLAIQSASYAQSAAGLATSITTDIITAAGVAATLENSTGLTNGFFAAGLSAGDSGATATLCLDSVTGGTLDPNCFAGNESVVGGPLSTSDTVVSPDNNLAVIGASALPTASLPPGPPIPAGGNVVVLFDSVFPDP